MADALYIGLISGTSADGIDAALVRCGDRLEVLRARTAPYPPDLRARLLAAAHAESLAVDEYGLLDAAVGQAFAEAALVLLGEAGIDARAVRAIGSHGQTIRHRPRLDPAFTLQIGDPSRIAEATGIPTIADFRRADVAAGGQGAPLAPGLHADALADASEVRAVLNLGGIANLTLLVPGEPVRGFDTGPANCLLDLWAERHLGSDCDEGGCFAASGLVDADLLARLLADDYFCQPPPKSTGREHFHAEWLAGHLDPTGLLSAADVQSTLLELSVRSIVDALRLQAPATRRVIACGGGVHNREFMRRLARALEVAMPAPCVLESSAAHGLDPDFVEAALFAWLAWRHETGLPGNLVEVTGARGPRVLGARYPGHLR
jgi:anhydro-N-acetylmuramic acid kinase